MEPRIQYAKTSDGVRIAYATFGSGPPLVFASQILGSLHMAQKDVDLMGYWSIDDFLTVARSIVTYDHRGCGSSDRRVSDYSLEARVRDLEAVVQATRLERFPLVGYGHAAATAVAFAVDHPELVEEMVLCNAFVSGSQYYETIPAVRALRAMDSMAEDEWEYLTRSLATGVLGFSDLAKSDKLARARQGAMVPSDWVKYRQVAEATHIGSLLPRVAVPTLVIRDDSIPVGNEFAREVAAGIPEAQFIVSTDYKREIRELFGAAPTTAATPLPSGMTAILFADIAGSTALTETLGDAAFRAKARELGGSLRALIREHSGTPVEGPTLGDGVMAVFASAREAIAAALRCAAAGESAGLSLHLGLHAGDVTREKDPDGRANVYGGAVNIASRISGLSAPGEVLVSDVVRTLARTSADVRFEDRGEQALKGVGEPVRVWAVQEAEA